MMKPVFYNDSERLVVGNKGQGVCPNAPYDYVIMSKGKFRELTSIDIAMDKCFEVNYVLCNAKVVSP